MWGRGKKSLAEGCLPGCGVWLLDHLLKPHAFHGALNVRNWNYLVEQFGCRNAKQAGRAARTHPCPWNDSPNRQSAHEGNGPRADHDGRLIVDENDIDTRVGQHPLWIVAL